MVGFGLGFGSHSMSRQYAALGQNVPVSALRPSAFWNGTAGSGFSGSPPADPVRITAKPACRLLVPPNQYFTEELVIGVWAGAINDGSLLDNLGIEKVIAHCEGQSFEIAAPSFYLFEDANGNAVRYYGWWVVLQHPGTHGHAHVYFEAVPKDPAMQRRVIGPYQFSPQPVLHDYQLTIAPSLSVITGSRYQTWQSALAFLAANNAQNPLITFTEAMSLDMSVSGAGFAGGNGYTTVAATAPVTFRKASLSTNATARLFRTGYDGLWFTGSNITIDFKDASVIYHENPANRDHVFEGVRFIKSDGANATFLLSTDDTLYIARDNPWFLECTVEEVSLPFVGANLARGCSGSGGTNDIAGAIGCFVANTFHDWNSGNWRVPISAMTVQYTGAGTGTIEISGANNVVRTITAKVGGSTIGTFVTTVDEAGFLANTRYTVANVVAWVNTLPGWTATLLDNTRRASALSLSGVTAFGAFGATDCKTVPLTLITAFDLHTDMWRTSHISAENIVCADNNFYNCVGQGFWISSGLLRDIIIVNNTMDQDDTDPDAPNSFSQVDGPSSHVVFAHNSLTQGLNLRTAGGAFNPDAYCVAANNVAKGIAWTGAADADLILKDNHLFTGAAVPSGSTGTSVGGTKATLFANPANGDFTPQGTLLGILKTPSLRHDRNGAARALPSVLGALVGPGEVAPAITSGNPSGTYPENLPVGGTLAANKPVTWSVTGVDAAAVTLDPAAGNWTLQPTDFETKTSYAFTFVATDSANDTAMQAVAIVITDLDEIAPMLSAPQGTAVGTSGANLSVTTNEGNGTLFWYVSTGAVPPSVATLMAGTGAVAGGSQAVAAAGTTTASVSGLAAGTAYYAYFLHRDGAGNNSTIVSGSSFTTNAASGGSVSVVSSAVVLKTSDLVGSFVAAPFTFAGGTDRVLVAVVTLRQQSTQLSSDVTLSVNGTAMVRLAGSAHSVGASRPICAVFVATGQSAGSKTITVNVAGNARSCSVLAMEVAGLNTANLLANSTAIEGNTLTYSHSYTPTAAGNLILSALATRQGDRGAFAPDALMTELQDDSTGTTATSDHSVFVGYAIAAGTTAMNAGATTTASTDALFLVTELRKA